MDALCSCRTTGVLSCGGERPPRTAVKGAACEVKCVRKRDEMAAGRE